MDRMVKIGLTNWTIWFIFDFKLRKRVEKPLDAKDRTREDGA